MKKYISILALALAAFAGCKEQDIPTYNPEDCTVKFTSTSSAFSLIGVADEHPTLVVDVVLVGTIVDYDRKIDVEVVDSEGNTAAEGKDFTITSAVLEAGQSRGHIVLTVNQLSDGVGKLSTTIRIVPSEDFPYLFYGKHESVIVWSNEYVRPTNAYVWRSWYLFFCNGYSQNLHKLLIQELGQEIETTSYYRAATNEGMSYKVIGWWYTASRQFYDAVRLHDQANPDSPYMHSSDYEQYSSDQVPVGSGKKPETIPTILSTLLVL